MLITSNQMDLSRFRFYPDFWLLHNVLLLIYRYEDF